MLFPKVTKKENSSFTDEMTDSDKVRICIFICTSVNYNAIDILRVSMVFCDLEYIEYLYFSFLENMALQQLRETLLFLL